MTGETASPVVCCDLDGVIWRGERAIRGSAAACTALRRAGLRLAFLSNNSSQTVGEVVARLAGAGIDASADDVLTSALAAADMLAAALPPRARVLPCAGPGVVEALAGAGFAVVHDAPADAVVVGWHRDFDFDGLDRASRAVRAGARFVATNLDATYPIPGGFVPGAGAIVAAVATASGREPEVAGKPYPPTVDTVRRRFGTEGVVIGDRPSTDGKLAEMLGWPFALVLSGVTARVAPAGGEAIPEPAPPFVADDLAGLAPRLLAAFETR